MVQLSSAVSGKTTHSGVLKLTYQVNRYKLGLGFDNVCNFLRLLLLHRVAVRFRRPGSDGQQYRWVANFAVQTRTLRTRRALDEATGTYPGSCVLLRLVTRFEMNFKDKLHSSK